MVRYTHLFWSELQAEQPNMAQLCQLTKVLMERREAIDAEKNGR